MGENSDKRDIGWINAAKGVSILLVVLMHVQAYAPAIGWTHYARIDEAWKYINGFFHPIRMPLFFLISGLLASKSIDKSDKITEYKRIIRPAYMYILWAIILMVLLPFDPTVGPVPRTISDSSIWILMIASPAWYFIALSIFFYVAKTTNRFNSNIVIPILIIMSIFSSIFESYIPGHQHKMLRCAVFFVMGSRYKKSIIDLVGKIDGMCIISLFLIYIPCAYIVSKYETFFIIVDAIAVLLSLSAVKFIFKNENKATNLIKFIGKKTLGIYVFHFFIVSIFVFYTKDYYEDLILDSYIIGLVYPLLVLVIVIPTSIVFQEIAKMLRMNWLFEIPNLKSALNHTPIKLVGR